MKGTIAILGLAMAVPSLATAQPAQPACNSAEHAQFDFWVGEWDVAPNGSDVKVATSKIEKLYGGCAVRENWMPLKGAGGGSINAWDARDKRWHQAWADSTGSWVQFSGGLASDAMVLTGLWSNLVGPGKDALVRMIYTLRPDGTVRQLGEQSVDHGRTWTVSFDYIYRRRATAR